MVRCLFLSLFLLYPLQTWALVRYNNNFWATQWLNATQLEKCQSLTAQSPPAGRCNVMAECIFESISDYASIGLSSGTSVLSLIPGALALLPSRGRGVEKTLDDMGWFYLLLAIFSGYVSIGESSNDLAAKVENDTLPNRDRLQESYIFASGLIRFAIYTFIVVLVGIVVYLSTQLGLETLVTWACNHELLHVGWVFCRMLPAIQELILVRILCLWLNKHPSLCIAGRGSPGWLLSKAVYGFSIALWGLVLIYGTGLFGSTSLIDGSEVMWKYMLLFPVLYCSIQAGLEICQLRTSGGGLRTVARHVPKLERQDGIPLCSQSSSIQD